MQFEEFNVNNEVFCFLIYCKTIKESEEEREESVIIFNFELKM